MLRKYRRVFFRNEWIKNTIKLMQERLKQGVESSTSRTIHYLLKVCDPFSPPQKFFSFPSTHESNFPNFTFNNSSFDIPVLYLRFQTFALVMYE